jgi:hypothetical protein
MSRPTGISRPAQRGSQHISRWAASKKSATSYGHRHLLDEAVARETSIGRPAYTPPGRGISRLNGLVLRSREVSSDMGIRRLVDTTALYTTFPTISLRSLRDCKRGDLGPCCPSGSGRFRVLGRTASQDNDQSPCGEASDGRGLGRHCGVTRYLSPESRGGGRTGSRCVSHGVTSTQGTSDTAGTTVSVAEPI